MGRLTFFHPQSRAELLIATGRIILAVFFLLAIWLDPPDPPRFAGLTYSLLSGYMVFSLFAGATVWHSDHIRLQQRLFSHVIDLIVFAVLMYLTTGPTSPFFVYFIFLLVCATLRWQWHGTLLTALAAIGIMTALLFFPHNLLLDRSFELNRFLIRIIYLAVIAAMLGYLGKHELSMREMLYRLAEYPRAMPAEINELVREILNHATGILKAPRLVLLWEDDEEPWLYTASLSGDDFTCSREHPQAFGTIVAAELAGSSFLCQDLLTPAPTVVRTSDRNMGRWHGFPLDSRLRDHFSIRAVLATCIKGTGISGYLFTLDRPMMTQDDLMLGEIIAHEIETRLEHYQLLARIRQSAADEERLRLARDLHDGVLQSLTGAALQLEAAQKLLADDHNAARQRIRETQELLANEQRDLRSHINELRPYAAKSPQEDFPLLERLEELAAKIRQQWDHNIEITAPPYLPAMPRSIAREIYFVIHEAVFNAARHAEATSLRAELGFAARLARIRVIDNGRGFPFQGRYDQDQLSEMKRGPVTLRERISALHGTLLINSAANGAELEITLPLDETGG